MNSKRTKILIVGSVVILALLTIGGIFKWKKILNNYSEKVNKPEPNQPAEKCFKCGKECGSSPIKKNEKIYCSQKCADNDNEEGNNNKEKDLVEKIKNDLKERIKRVKNGSRDFEDIMPYIYDKKGATCQVKDLNFIKEGEEILPADVGEESFQSIINLNKQIISVRKEWEEKKRQEAQKKADANPNLFYFPAKGSFVGGILTDEISNFQFDGRQDGKTYKLIIPVLHPDLANISIKSDDWNLYRITGIENIPLLPHPMGRVKNWLYKIVKPSDRFTIEKIDF